MPATHDGTWKLNAKAFRQQSDNADRIAAIAALRAFGADVATASADGEFSINADPQGTLLVVSRHAEQGLSVPDPRRAKLLSTWFDSPSHLAGRLAVSVQPINKTARYTIQFTK